MALKVGELYASFGIDSSSLDGAMNSITNQCNQIASSMTGTGVKLSAAVTTPIIKLGKDMYTAGTDFYEQMSKVQAIAQLDSTVQEDAEAIKALTQAAIQMGSTTKFTATEAGTALQYMAMAGWDTNEMLAGLAPVMNLAAASGEDLGDVSDIVTDAMTAFGLTSENAAKEGVAFTDYVNRFSDVLAMAANKTNTDISLMGTSFRYIAPVAGSMGYAIEDVAVALGILANNGIKSTMAGTTLRNVITNLANPTDAQANVLKKLNVSLSKADGTMYSFAEVIDQLRDGFSCLDPETKAAYASIIGGKQSMAGLLALMNATDQEIEELTAAMYDCDGATQEMADTMLDNAKGDVTIFKSAVEGLEITLWGLVEGSFRSFVQGATGVVDSFRLMDQKTQVATLKMAGLAAAAGPVLLAGGRIVKAVGAIGPAFASMLSPLGVVTTGLALFAIAAVDANNDIGKSLEAISLKAKKSLTTGNASLAVTMKKISDRIPAIAGSIVKVVGNTVPGIFELGFTAMTGFADSISANANVIADVGMSIVKNVSSGLSKGLPQLIPAATSMLLNIGSALISNIPALLDSAIEVGAAIWSGVKAGIVVAGDWLKQIVLGEAYTPDADWSTVGAAIWPAITNGITAAGDWVKQKVLGESYTADASWSTVGSAIWTQIQTGITATGDWIKALILGNAFTADSDWSDVGEKIASMISGGLAKLDFSSDEMTANVSSIGNFMQTFVQKMLETPVKVSASIATFISSIVSSIAAYDGWSSLTTTFGTIATSLIDGIVAAVPTITTGATTFITAIGSMISSIGSSDILPAATSLATQIINSIAAGIPAVASGASSIISALGSTLSGIDWGAIAGDMLTSATTIGEALMNALIVGISHLGDLGVDIVEAVSGILSSINWETVTVGLDGFGQMLTNGIVNGISALGTAGAKIVEAVGNLFVDLDWSGLADTTARLGNVLIDGIVKGVGALANAGTQIVTALTTVISNVNWEEVGTAAVDLAGKLFDGLLTGAAEITPDVSALMSSLGRGISAAGAGLGEAAGSLIANLVTAICSPENWTSLVATGGEIVRGLGEGIINLGVGIIEGAWNLLAGTVKTLLEDLGLIAKEKPITIHYTEDGTPKIGGGLKFEEPAETTAAAQETVTAAEVALKTLPNTAELLGGDAATGLATGIKNNGSTATAAMNTLSDEVVKAALKEMSYDTGYQTGFDYAGAMNAGILAQQGPVAASAGVVALAAKNMAASTISYFVGSGIGYQFSSGIAGGIRSGISLISAAAASAANAAVISSQNTLEIHSPSRRGEKEVGWLYDEGIAKGILGNYDVISRAASDVTESMHRSFYIGDPSHGTVFTARRSASQSAIETEAAINDPRSLMERSKMLASALASELMSADENRNITIVLTLDGRVVAKGLAPYASEELAVTPEWT